MKDCYGDLLKGVQKYSLCIERWKDKHKLMIKLIILMTFLFKAQFSLCITQQEQQSLQ